MPVQQPAQALAYRFAFLVSMLISGEFLRQSPDAPLVIGVKMGDGSHQLRDPPGSPGSHGNQELMHMVQTEVNFLIIRVPDRARVVVRQFGVSLGDAKLSCCKPSPINKCQPASRWSWTTRSNTVNRVES